MKTYNSQAEYIPLPRESRSYLHTTTAGGVLPFIQASLTGLILGVVVLALALLWRWRNPGGWGLGVGLATWAAAWLFLQWHWYTQTRPAGLLSLPRERGSDPQPEAPAREIRIRVSEVRPGGHYHESVYPLPADLPQLQALAQGLTQGRPFSEREWTGSGKPFSVAGFKALRSEMIKRGLICLANDKDVRQGYQLTPEGWKMVNGLVEGSPQNTQGTLE